MSLFNLKQSQNQLSLQPSLDFQRRGFQLLTPALLVVVAGYIVPPYFLERQELGISIYIISGMLFVWTLFSYFVQSKVIIEFNRAENYVYQKNLLFRRKLIKISVIHSIDPKDYNGELQYCITMKKDRYGKNYPVTNYFSSDCKELIEFENSVLPKLLGFIESEAGSFG